MVGYTRDQIIASLSRISLGDRGGHSNGCKDHGTDDYYLMEDTYLDQFIEDLGIGYFSNTTSWDHYFYIELKEVILGEQLAHPTCTRKKVAPLNDYSDVMEILEAPIKPRRGMPAGSKEGVEEELDDFDSDDFDMSELDLDGFDFSTTPCRGCVKSPKSHGCHDLVGADMRVRPHIGAINTGAGGHIGATGHTRTSLHICGNQIRCKYNKQSFDIRGMGQLIIGGGGTQVGSRLMLLACSAVSDGDYISRLSASARSGLGSAPNAPQAGDRRYWCHTIVQS